MARRHPQRCGSRNRRLAQQKYRHIQCPSQTHHSIVGTCSHIRMACFSFPDRSWQLSIEVKTPTLEASLKSGIYMIWNRRNHRVYVGSAAILRKRKREHWRELRLGIHFNGYLQAAFDKEPWEFYFVVVEVVATKDDLRTREQFWMNKVHVGDRSRCYNIALYAEQSCNWVGRKHRPETIAKMKGRVFTPEHRANISHSRKGLKIGPNTPETNAKRSAALKGRKRSESELKAHSEALRKSSKFQKHLVEMAARKKGKPLSLEHRTKVSLGLIESHEQRRKVQSSEHTHAELLTPRLVCNRCKHEWPLTDFRIQKQRNGTIRRRKTCKHCHNSDIRKRVRLRLERRDLHSAGQTDCGFHCFCG